MRALDREFELYRRNVENASQKSIYALISDDLSAESDITGISFDVEAYSFGESDVVQGILQSLLGINSRTLERNGLMEEKELLQLGLEFIKAARESNYEKMKLYVENDYPVNFQEPSTLRTALHIAAYNQDIKAVDLLLNSGKCDLLIQDRASKLPCMDALFNPGVEVQKLLAQKTRSFAKDKCVDLPTLIGECSARYWNTLNGF